MLWNQANPPGPFTTYGNSSTFYGIADIRDPSTVAGAASYYSLLCLTCHDGVVAIADFQFNPTYGVTAILGAGAFTGTAPPNITVGGLANDHPVDFTYSVLLATTDGGLQSPTGGGVGSIPYIEAGANDLPLFKDLDADASGRLECATCHNPHNNTNVPFLRVSNAGSALCLSCQGI